MGRKLVNKKTYRENRRVAKGDCRRQLQGVSRGAQPGRLHRAMQNTNTSVQHIFLSLGWQLDASGRMKGSGKGELTVVS